MHVPKSVDQELADGHLRQLKRLLLDAIVTKPNYGWQCRYQLRRIGVVSKEDPNYPRETAGRPKFWPVAGIEVSGRPFLDRTMVSKIVVAEIGDVEASTIEQEMIALVR